MIHHGRMHLTKRVIERCSGDARNHASSPLHSQLLLLVVIAGTRSAAADPTTRGADPWFVDNVRQVVVVEFFQTRLAIFFSAHSFFRFGSLVEEIGTESELFQRFRVFALMT